MRHIFQTKLFLWKVLVTFGEVEGTGKICEKNFSGVWLSELAINIFLKIEQT